MWFPPTGLESSAYGVGTFDGRVEYFPLTYLVTFCILSMLFRLFTVRTCWESRFMFGVLARLDFSICNLERGFK